MTATHDKMKIGVIIVLVLFVGSSIGLGVLMIPSQTNEIKLPDKVVLNMLDPEVEKYIINGGGTVIYFEREKNCTYCALLLEKIKEIADALSPYVFIVYKEGQHTQLKLKNALGEKIITSGGLKDIVSFICATVPPSAPTYTQCVDLAITIDNKSILSPR